MTDDIREFDDVAEATIDFVEEVSDRFGSGLAVGLFVGLASGAVAGYFFAQRHLQTKFSKLADDEIAEMREHYQAKGRALEAEAGKLDLADLVKERGYVSPGPEISTSPPMAVKPPKSVTEDGVPDDSAMGEDDVEGPEGVKAQGEAGVRNVFRDREPEVVHEWDKHTELRRRSPDTPYVVHYDERHDMEGYSDVSYTYYAKDDVLCDEKDEIVDPADRDRLVGEANLDRFGHGSGDAAIVFIRNDNLEILYEIIRSPNSFAEEVHGFTHESWDRGNLERMRRRERDDET